MKKINKGLGFLAIAGVAVVVILVTKSFPSELGTLVLGGFALVGFFGN